MMRQMVLAAALAAALAAQAQQAASGPGAAAASAATTVASTAPAAPSVEAGRRAYTSTCARCHGINLVVTSSSYFDLRVFPRDEKARFLDSVTNGKRQMPAWRGIVQPETMESIWLYIGSVNGW